MKRHFKHLLDIFKEVPIYYKKSAFSKQSAKTHYLLQEYKNRNLPDDQEMITIGEKFFVKINLNSVGYVIERGSILGTFFILFLYKVMHLFCTNFF